MSLQSFCPTSLCSLCSSRKKHSGKTAPAALLKDQAAFDGLPKNSKNARRIHNARCEEFERGAGRKSSLSPPKEDKRSPKSTATADTESSSVDSDSDVGSKTAIKRKAFQSRAAKSAAKRKPAKRAAKGKAAAMAATRDKVEDTAGGAVKVQVFVVQQLRVGQAPKFDPDSLSVNVFVELGASLSEFKNAVIAVVDSASARLNHPATAGKPHPPLPLWPLYRYVAHSTKKQEIIDEL